jgi:hypothetical protein
MNILPKPHFQRTSIYFQISTPFFRMQLKTHLQSIIDLQTCIRHSILLFVNWNCAIMLSLMMSIKISQVLFICQQPYIAITFVSAIQRAGSMNRDAGNWRTVLQNIHFKETSIFESGFFSCQYGEKVQFR